MRFKGDHLHDIGTHFILLTKYTEFKCQPCTRGMCIRLSTVFDEICEIIVLSLTLSHPYDAEILTRLTSVNIDPDHMGGHYH